jgi:uncharacterized repeat protein (TIGR03943 family)
MSSSQPSNRSFPITIPNFLLPWLDIFAIGAWGVMMLKYWITGKLYLLIHPDFFWLVVVAGVSFLALSFIKLCELIIRRWKQPNVRMPAVQHFSFFPPGWGAVLLLITAILGLLITPQVFASQTALDRGVTDTLTATRSQPQSFRSAKKSEDRSLIDWVRTLSVYPEPDEYTGQKAKVQGFVIHPPNLPPQYLMISRFVLTCCAADAYPVGLPVKLSQTRQAYPPDTWLEIEGKMITETLENHRQLVIESSAIKTIPKPKNPYEY